MMSLERLLANNKDRIALVIGNGVNRYNQTSASNSWDALLGQLAERHIGPSAKSIPEGISITEFYDVLELKAKARGSLEEPLQKEFCRLMKGWTPGAHHEAIVDWAKNHQAPLLTTNFERVFATAGDCALRRTVKGHFTDFYPWESYYGDHDIQDPASEFAIWHINGMEKYRRSIRLGLTHYMGSVERARGWIHKGKKQRLFSGSRTEEWRGSKTWLHTFMQTPLLIFGLGLQENEVFLRWLLVERARYFQEFPERTQRAWFIHRSSAISPGQQYFLEGVGIELLEVSEYDDLYSPSVWS